MSTGDQIEFLHQKHPAQRTTEQFRAELIEAQQSIIARVFHHAGEFCAEVLDNLKLSIPTPRHLLEQPVSAIADLDFAGLKDFFVNLVTISGIPASAAEMHAENLSRRAQLLRAFKDPDIVLTWATTKVVEVIADLPKTAKDIEIGRNPGDVLDPYLLVDQI
jgi:hypothetical protein